MRLELQTDNDIAFLEGELTLVSFNEVTQDFQLKIQKKGLHFLKEPYFLSPEEDGRNWDWLLDFSLQSLKVGEQVIYPTWKPNRYGEVADENAFQKVTFSETEILIEVAALGTPEEVFNRYNPYEVLGSTEKRFRNFHEVNLTEAEYEAQQIEAEKKGDEWLKDLFN